MSDQAITKKLKVGIVGAGKAGCRLLELYHNNRFSQVVFLVDIQTDAPGIKLAKKMGIPVLNDCGKAIETLPVDLVLEVTGRDEAVERLTHHVQGKPIQLITHQSAFVMLNVMEENSANNRHIVRDEIRVVQNEINHNMTGIDELVDEIEEITGDMHMLALNARIEAARVGEQGKGFAIVAQQMASSADTVRNITQKIEAVNASVLQTSQKINQVLDALA